VGVLAGVDEHASAVGEFYPAFEVGCLSRPQSDLGDRVEHLADHRGIFLLGLRVHGLVLFKKLVVLEYQIVIEEAVVAVPYGAGNRGFGRIRVALQETFEPGRNIEPVVAVGIDEAVAVDSFLGYGSGKGLDALGTEGINFSSS